MENRDLLVFGLLLLQPCFIKTLSGAFICNSLSDSMINIVSQEHDSKRLKAMEEKITQLQKLATAELQNATSLKDSIPADCAELYDRGVRSDGVYIISPDGRCPFRVYCDMLNGGWTLIQKRQDGSVSFYRPWDEYVAGFGDIEGEHWLGLDKIHRLSKAGTQIYFLLENYDDTFEHAHYKAFTVHDVTTAYRMNVDDFGYEGTLKKGRFGYHNDMKFSTFDRDNDVSSSNCCQSADGGGWWFRGC